MEKLNLNEISSIEIIKSDRTNENEITVTDPSQIIKIMDAFFQMKLKESNLSNINFKTSYWTVNAVSQKKRLKSYIITNNLDRVANPGLNNLQWKSLCADDNN